MASHTRAIPAKEKERRAEERLMKAGLEYAATARRNKIQLLGNYTGVRNDTLHKCLTCKHEWLTKPATVTQAIAHKTPTRGCPECKRRRYVYHFSLSQQEYVDRLVAKGSILRPVQDYDGTWGKIMHECTKCKHQQLITPSNALQKGRCQGCAAGFYLRKPYKLGRKTVYVQGAEPKALDLLLRRYTPAQIAVSGAGHVPYFSYRFQGVWRQYRPDAYIDHVGLVVEVKSVATMGLTSGFRGKPGRYWHLLNKAKALSVIGEGYRYQMMVFRDDGTLVPLPKSWYKLTLTQLRTYL